MSVGDDNEVILAVETVEVSPAELGKHEALQIVPLGACPSCGYLLEGLPEIHRCPECSFEYDKRMQVVEQSGGTAWIALFAVVAYVAGLFTFQLTLKGKILYYLFCPAGIIFAAWAAWRYFTGRRNKVIVWNNGIIVLNGRKIAKKWEQERITQISFNEGIIGIRVRPVNVQHNIGEMVLGTADRLKRVENLLRYFFKPVGIEFQDVRELVTKNEH